MWRSASHSLLGCMLNTPQFTFAHHALRTLADQIRLMDACCYTGRVRPDEEADVPFREDRWAGA